MTTLRRTITAGGHWNGRERHGRRRKIEVGRANSRTEEGNIRLHGEVIGGECQKEGDR